PIWTISSSGDAVVPIQWAKDWISWIDQYNPAYASQTKVTVWTTESHNATWVRAFNPTTKVDGLSIYEWMLLHKRGSASAAPPVSSPAPVPSGNKAPVANAGEDQTIDLAWNYWPTLYGHKSADPDGYLPSFNCTNVTGPASFAIATPNVRQTEMTNLMPGTFVFRVAVKDNNGATAHDDVTVIVKGTGTGSSGRGGTTEDGNRIPIADAGADQNIP